MDRDFLGVGWKFPIQVAPNGKIAQSRFEQKIEEAIYLVLSTAPKERPMLAKFGCGIHDLVFSPNNPATSAEIVSSVREALTQFEARIDLLSVDVSSPSDEGNVLLIRIDYRVRANNARANLVYPFYITEGA